MSPAAAGRSAGGGGRRANGSTADPSAVDDPALWNDLDFRLLDDCPFGFDDDFLGRNFGDGRGWLANHYRTFGSFTARATNSLFAGHRVRIGSNHQTGASESH